VWRSGGAQGRSRGGRGCGRTARRKRGQFDRRRGGRLRRQIDPDRFLLGLDLAGLFLGRHGALRNIRNIVRHKINCRNKAKVGSQGCQPLFYRCRSNDLVAAAARAAACGRTLPRMCVEQNRTWKKRQECRLTDKSLLRGACFAADASARAPLFTWPRNIHR
jgi:hypothetical protein